MGGWRTRAPVYRVAADGGLCFDTLTMMITWVGLITYSNYLPMCVWPWYCSGWWKTCSVPMIVLYEQG